VIYFVIILTDYSISDGVEHDTIMSE